jgi:hypothetical protein
MVSLNHSYTGAVVSATKHYVMETYGGLNVVVQILLTSALSVQPRAFAALPLRKEFPVSVR